MRSVRNSHWCLERICADTLRVIVRSGLANAKDRLASA